MPRQCSVCTSTDRPAIDGELVRATPLRTIASRYGVTRQALHRHRQTHLPASLVRDRQATELANAEQLLEQITDLQRHALSALARAEAMGDQRGALAAIREARACLEILAKISGQLLEAPGVSLTLSPEWSAVRMVILEALQDHPKARLAVADALQATIS